MVRHVVRVRSSILSVWVIPSMAVKSGPLLLSSVWQRSLWSNLVLPVISDTFPVWVTLLSVWVTFDMLLGVLASYVLRHVVTLLGA